MPHKTKAYIKYINTNIAFYYSVYVSGKVIKKGEKYLVELSCYGLLTNIIRELDVLIVVNRPNLTEKNFLLKTTPAEIAGS